MEQHNSNTNETSSATTQSIPGACHQPVQWLSPAAQKNHDARFAATVMDVARGVKTIVSILAVHITDHNTIALGAGASVRMLLNETDTEALARLAVYSLDQLAESAEVRVEHFNDLAGREA